MNATQSRRRWLRWGSLGVLIVSFFVAVRHSVWAAHCRIAMVEQAMPARLEWQSWRLLSGLAGFEVVDLETYRDWGLTSWRPHAMGDARLVGHGVCAERGASVQSWFGQYFTATTGDDWTIRVREEPKGGVFLVTGERTRPGAELVEPSPIVAFRVERDGLAHLLMRVLGLPVIVLALFVAWLGNHQRLRDASTVAGRAGKVRW